MSSRRQFGAFVDDVRNADLIVVVAHVPDSFSPMSLPNVEILRERLSGVPIVNYDLEYLPTLDSWARYILRGERTNLSDEAVRVFEKGKFGLERYDWYLMASVGSFVPMPPGPQPFSLIGIDIDDGTLYPDQQDHFQALVDFEQPRLHYPQFREVQLEALRIAGVDYVVLEGSYTIEEIKAIYRRTSIYFLAHAESFGLPIAELQGCGSLVFMPDPHWACAHWLGDDYKAGREPRLSPNFVVYENDPATLAARIRAVAKTADPARARSTFLREQPQLFRGDRTVLKDFLKRVESGAIHSELHGEHRRIGRSA